VWAESVAPFTTPMWRQNFALDDEHELTAPSSPPITSSRESLQLLMTHFYILCRASRTCCFVS
jgi:hypothetical protein